MEKIGQTIIATVSAPDSIFKIVMGQITKIREDGWVGIDVTKFKTKWSKKWETHPSKCSTYVRYENIIY